MTYGQLYNFVTLTNYMSDNCKINSGNKFKLDSVVKKQTKKSYSTSHKLGPQGNDELRHSFYLLGRLA